MPQTAACNDLALEAALLRARSEASAGFECSPDGAFWRLCIWGRFPPDWCGNLSLQCYAARQSVLAADASRLESSLWAGVFLLAPAEGAGPARALDFVRMARRRPTGIAQPNPMQIDLLRIEPEASGGSARVQIGGPDRIGFLAFVLDQLAFCGLYPHQLSVRTSSDGRAEDCFRVHGVGGTPPLPRSLAALEAIIRTPPQPMRAL